MKNITSFLESKMNESASDEYVVDICDAGSNGNHDYSVANFWGPLQGDWEEEDKLDKVLGHHKGDEDNMPCNVRIVSAKELLNMLKVYNHNNTTESTLKEQGSRYALSSFLSMFEY